MAGTDLGPDRVPLWQRAVGGLQWVLALVALAGALWLLVLVALGFFQLDDVVPLPRVQGVPLPTLLLAGGLLAGLLLALVARPLVRLRARRRGRAAERRLRTAVDAVAEDELLAPMAAVREDADRFRDRREAAARSLVGVEVRGRGARAAGCRGRSLLSVRPEGSRAQTCLRPGRSSQP